MVLCGVSNHSHAAKDDLPAGPAEASGSRPATVAHTSRLGKGLAFDFPPPHLTRTLILTNAGAFWGQTTYLHHHGDWLQIGWTKNVRWLAGIAMPCAESLARSKGYGCHWFLRHTPFTFPEPRSDSGRSLRWTCPATTGVTGSNPEHALARTQ